MNIIEELKYLSTSEITPSLSRQLRLYGDAKINEVIVPLQDYALEYFTTSVMAKIQNPCDATGRILEWNLTSTSGANGTEGLVNAVRSANLSCSLFSAANLLYCCAKAIEDNSVPERLQELIVGAFVGLDSDDVAKGKKFPAGKSKGSTSKSTDHIFELAKDNLELSAKELFSKSDKSIIENMSERTFGNHVTAARRQYPKKRKAAK
jgi:hypothetical protein